MGQAREELMGSRDAILNRIRRSLGVSAAARPRLDAVADRLARHPQGPIPARGQLDAAGRVELFSARAVAVMSTVARVGSAGEIPAAVAAYLGERSLAPEIRTGDDPLLTGLDWQGAGLAATRGASSGSDLACVSHADFGVAETGTLVLTSGPDNPTTLNFLPDYHVVVVETGRIVGDYETALAAIRSRDAAGRLPRTVNLITGPSRSADIEETLLLGAHGPRSLHIVIVG
jgi:L-lactate dehydrogenase complex protein LldG